MCYQGCSQTHGEVVVGEAGTLLVVHSVERCLTADYGADHVESTCTMSVVLVHMTYTGFELTV